MNTILALWDEVRAGVRTSTSFAVALVGPELEDEMGHESDGAWSLYEDLCELAGMFVEENIYEDQYLAITGDHIAQYRAGKWPGQWLDGAVTVA